jgi:hypothetical protein
MTLQCGELVFTVMSFLISSRPANQGVLWCQDRRSVKAADPERVAHLGNKSTFAEDNTELVPAPRTNRDDADATGGHPVDQSPREL